MEYEKSKYWLWLTYIKNMWSEKARKTIEFFDSPEALFEANEKDLIKSGIFGEGDIYNILAAKNEDIEKKWSELERKNIRFTHIGHKQYPQKLGIYKDKPLWLFYKGALPDDNDKCVGIVGARNCSRYGAAMAESVSEQLGRNKVSVISGMARGIDAMAHKGALKAGVKTYAVLGCGVDVCYPRENIELYMQIIANGGLISEYIPGTEPLSWQFPERNRIISMFSDVVAVIEAKKNSGSLITTDYALQYGKEIFAMPGRVGDKLSEGCNELIKSGAALLTEAEDMVFALGGFDVKDVDGKKNKSHIVLEKENEVVYSCLGLLPQNIETIVKETGMTSSEVFGSLMQLIVMGMVTEPMKNHYARVK